MTSVHIRRLLFSITVFSSAVLLLLVQPILTKSILPWFGGAAGVWTSSMLFYQAVLLLGYLYSHLLSRITRARTQGLIHLVLLGCSLVALPLRPSETWKPAETQDPFVLILGLLFSSAGLPYFLLSATSPLIQVWYTRVAKERTPYRLFAVSNLGSLLALLSYPVLVEPNLSTLSQLNVWSVSYVVFGVLMAGISLWVFRSQAESVSRPAGFSGEAWLWIALSAVPSILWLALANHLSQDLAAVPFLWILPLSIYLLSFVLCFDSAGWYRPKIYRWLLPIAVVGLLFGIGLQPYLSFPAFVALYAVELLVVCMFCHGELVRRRPAPENVTAFYLAISIGGAFGGVFVGLIAPHLFTIYLELPLSVLACIVLSLGLLYNLSSKRVLRVGGTAAAAVIASFFVESSDLKQQHNLRNFYGTLQVRQSGTLDDLERSLYNGSIEHGMQYLSADKRRLPTTYYGRTSGVAFLIEALRHQGMRVGVIGLGVGTIAAYGQAGDYYRFYEINPLVSHLAMADFGYLRESAAKVEIVLGDGRISLEREKPENFDVLAVDAFAGDSIPVHLLTREAFAVYLRHLKPEGGLAIHVTNKHLELAPVVKAIADSYGLKSLAIHNGRDAARNISDASWIIVTANTELARRLEYRSSHIRSTGPLWTDDYSDLFRILK